MKNFALIALLAALFAAAIGCGSEAGTKEGGQPVQSGDYSAAPGAPGAQPGAPAAGGTGN